MPGPQPCSLTASPKIRTLLEKFARSRQKPASLVRRSQLILAMLDGANNAQIARQFQLHVDTPRLWRNRWRELYPQLQKLEAEFVEEDQPQLVLALQQVLTDEPTKLVPVPRPLLLPSKLSR